MQSVVVWSRNLKNEEAMANVAPQRHKGGGEFYSSRNYCLRIYLHFHTFTKKTDDAMKISRADTFSYIYEENRWCNENFSGG